MIMKNRVEKLEHEAKRVDKDRIILRMIEPEGIGYMHGSQDTHSAVVIVQA